MAADRSLAGAYAQWRTSWLGLITDPIERRAMSVAAMNSSPSLAFLAAIMAPLDPALARMALSVRRS